MKIISTTDARYLDNYKLKITFNHREKRVVDFKAFLSFHSHPQYDKYKKEENFKKFKIENGNVVWGKDWDMIFPVYALYIGKIV